MTTLDFRTHRQGLSFTFAGAHICVDITDPYHEYGNGQGCLDTTEARELRDALTAWLDEPRP